MDGHAEAEPCTRERAWFRSATSMDGLAQVHGWTFRSAWFRFRRCMDGLSKRDPRAKMTHSAPRGMADVTADSHAYFSTNVASGLGEAIGTAGEPMRKTMSSWRQENHRGVVVGKGEAQLAVVATNEALPMP